MLLLLAGIYSPRCFLAAIFALVITRYPLPSREGNGAEDPMGFELG